jgi:golgin subfamily B member 1
MADLPTAFVELLRSDDPEAARAQLESTLPDEDLTAARLRAKEDPGSAEKLSVVLGRMLVEAAPQAELIETAKAAAQRAPRDAAGNAVALLSGGVIWAATGDPKLAEPYFRRVRRAEPAHPQVLDFYRELFAAQESAAQLIQVLVQARRAATEATQRFALAMEVAEIAEQRLGSSDRAIEIWRAVLREDGHDPRATEALERLYREAGKWTALVDLLKDELDRIPNDTEHAEERIGKLLEIASLYRDRLKLDTMALATLQRILDIDPRHEQSLEALAETYAQAGRFNDLLGVYQRRMDAATEAGDEAKQIELLRKTAEIWLDRLGNPQRALEPLQRVLALSPKDREARSLLARIHEQRRDFRALISLRREELEERSGDEALELRIELARLAEERLGDRREAIDAWNAVLVHHGDVDRALAALARLYEREGRWASSAEILHRKLSYCTRDEAINLLNHLGGLYSDRLQSREDAVRVWAELLRLVPGHDKAIRRLRDAYIADRRWAELSELYDGQGRLQELVEVLQSAADRIAEVQERVELYRRVAAICHERLGQPERAVKALERTLAIQPDNLEVARELLPIYREQSNWARTMSTYEVLLRAAGGDDERLELIGAMQEVAEHKLASPALTQHWAAQAYQIRPRDERLRDRLEAAAERSDGWDELVRIFEARIAAEDIEDDERLLLLEKLAVIARDRLFKPDDAQRYFRRTVELDPRNDAAMEALEQIYTSTGRWDDLGEIYRKRLQVTEDDESRLETLRGLARLQEQHIGDLDMAIETYASILALRDDDESALDALARIYRTRGAWAELAGILERKLEGTDAHVARVPLVFELGQIHATRLRDADRAVREFLTVLEMAPGHRATVDALEDVRCSDPSVALPVAKGLLPYYRRVEDRPKEAEMMEIIVEAEEDTEARRGLLEQLASIYERMAERREDALRIRIELFKTDASSWEARRSLQRLADELGQVDALGGAYEVVLGQIRAEALDAEQEGRTLPKERATLRRDLLLEHAGLLQGALGRTGEAERAFAEVLEHDETHQGAYEALESLLRARGANDDLVTLYRRRVDVTFNPGEQKLLLSRIIEISASLGDRETAVQTAEELLDLIPDDVGTIELLARMYEQGETPEDREKLEEILGRWAELCDDPGRARALKVRRASLRMQHLGDAFGAVDMLGQVLGADPDDVEARRLLEELLSISEVQLQACALLEPIYTRIGNHEGRIRVLRVRRSQAEAIGSTDEAVAHLVEIARLQERELGDANAAFDAVREAYLMDPRRFDTRQEVERLGTQLGRFAELAEIWKNALTRDVTRSDRALEIELTTRVARLLDERLGDQEGARSAYADLLELDPPDASLAHEAVEKLCRLHLEAGDEIALVDAKRALLRFCDSTDEQVTIRLEIAGIQEMLRDRIGAALTYSEVLDLRPANGRALDALERLFEEEREWERLCEVLEHRISVGQEPRDRAWLWRRIGEIRRDHLDDVHRAIDAFQSVLDLKVGREDTVHALGCLVSLNERLERWPDVEDGLRRLTTLAHSDAERVELLLRTAQVLGKKLGRGSDALDLLKRVLDLAPIDSRARSEVMGYVELDETHVRAMRILMPLYEAEQNWPALLELEELQARKQPSGRRRLQALLQVARTQEKRIGDPDRAFGVLCESLAEAADQPELEEILDQVERLGAESDRAQRLLEAYSDTVDHILDAGLQKRVLMSQGRVALERLGRLDVARRAFERVLDLSPDDHDAADALEQIYVRQEEHEALANLLVSRADRTSDTSARDQYLIRAAEIHRASRGDAQGALRLYERLSTEGLERPEVQDVLEPLYAAAGRYPELAAHLNRKLARLSGHEAVDTHLRLGRLYGEKLDDPETGIRHMSLALRLDPDHAVATEELDRYLEDPNMRARAAQMLEPVFAAVADWRRLIQIHEIRLAEAPDEEARVRVLMRIAQIEEDQLEDLDRAFESWTRLFGEQPGNRYVRDQLGRLAGVLSRTERYATLLTEYVDNDGAGDDGDEVLAIVREAADLWSGMLRRPERAVPLLRRIWMARSDDEGRTFSALEIAMTQAEMWRELADAYWQEIDAAIAEDRQLDLLRRLATLSQEMLEDPAEAARAYQRMLEIKPDLELARGRLEQLLEATQRHAELLDLLRDRMTRYEDPEDRNAVAARIAEIQDGPLEDPDGAVDTLEGMLMEVVDDATAVRQLERVAQHRRELRGRVVAILRPVYERSGNVRRLVEIDEWQLGNTEDPERRHELYREMAELLSRSHDTLEAAFRVLCRAVAEPGPEHALRMLDEGLERLAELAGLRVGLADALHSAADGDALASDLDRRVQLLVRAARLRKDQGDYERVAQTLRKALELLPEHAEALGLLDEALVRLGFHEELSSILRRRADLAEGDAERIDLLRRLAKLHEEVLAQPEQAERAWRDLLEVEPNDREALRRLSRVYEASGSTEELREVLERQVEASGEPEERRALRMQLANLLRETVKDRAAEVDVLRALLVEAPSDDEALAALARALIAEERHAEAADVIGERAALAADDQRRAALVLEAARLFAGPLGDVPSAIERYEQVLELAPSQEGALGDLVELAKSTDHFEAAGTLVAPRLEQVDRFADLADVLDARARLSSDPAEQVDALRRLATVRHDRLEDREAALDAWVRLVDVVTVEALREVLEQGGRLAVQLGRGVEHVDMLATKSGDEEREPAARVVLATYAAEIAEDLLGDSARALAIFVPLVDAGIASVDVCGQIERIGRKLGELAAVERALHESARLVGDAGVQGATMVRLGDVRVERGDVPGALEAYREAFDSGVTEAIQGLERLMELGGDAPEAAVLDALEHAYQTVGDKTGHANVVAHRLRAGGPDDQPRLLEQVATLLDEGGGTPESALDAWGQLLTIDPEHTQALERLLSLGQSTSRLPQVADYMLAAADAAREQGGSSTGLALQAATIVLRELGAPSRARTVLEGVLAEQPEHLEALELLVDATRKSGDPEGLHEALRRSAPLEADPEKATALWAEAAEVAEVHLSDPVLALADLEQLLLVDESHAEAWRKQLSLLTAAADHERLAEALARRAVLVDDPAERRDLRYRLANVLVDKLDRVEDAITTYQDMLGDRPDDRDALRELEVLLRGLERWDDVRDVLERKLEVAQADERVDVLGTLAQLAESRLDDPLDAVERHQQILLEQPGHPASEAALERLLTGQERWVDLGEMYERRVERLGDAGDTEGRRQAAATLAALLAERLDHPERAEELLKELLDTDPSYVPGILGLASVYEVRGDAGAMRITLQRALETDPQGRDGAAVHLRLARLAEDEPEKRRSHLERALELDPSNAEATELLVELCRREERWDQLAHLLELAAGRVDDPEKRRSLVLERVDIQLEHLRDADGALRVLAALYEQVQDDVEINRRIADALFSAERMDEAAGMYHWLVEMGRRQKRSKALAHDLTRLARIELRNEDTNGAKDHLLEAYRIDTTNVETLMTLGQLHEHDEEWKEALKVYRTMLLQNADHSGLLRRGDIYVNLARAHVALDERGKARAMLRRGLEEDKEHPGIAAQLQALEEG